jgi:hypothetical protein
MCPFGKGSAAIIAEDDNPKLWLIKLGFSAIWAAITVGGHRRRDAGSHQESTSTTRTF